MGDNQITYSTIDSLPWPRILREEWRVYQPPVSVHVPIQPMHSPDLVHVDAALNACRRTVMSGQSSKDLVQRQQTREVETFVVQFALDNPPFVPDFRRSTMSLEDGRYPLVAADYTAWDLYYRFEYFSRAIDDTQSILWIRGMVSNEGETPQEAHVRAKVNFQRECDLFDYHYVSLYWDASKWPTCACVSLRDDAIQKDSQNIGRVIPGDFSYTWEKAQEFTDEQYNRKFGCSTPYFVEPAMRLKNPQDVIHFSADLAPGQQKSFALALLVNTNTITPGHQAALKAASPDEDRRTTRDHFTGICDSEKASMTFPAHNWDKIFDALPISMHQLLIQFPDSDNYMPTQGGTSERHFVWVWEAVFMLRCMLRLGYFAPVRKSLDFIFSLQDGGYPPEGEFTTLEGAIGTTGPRWINSTGSALALAADYYLYSRDEDFLAEYLPKIERAAGWITGELRATRVLNDDGTRPPTYGLMPFGCATDGDTGHIVAFSDAFTFWGLEKCVRMLESIQHDRAKQLRDDLEQYRTDIDAAVEYMTRPDGYIERKMIVRDASEGIITNKFENTCSAMQMAFTGNLDVTSPVFDRFVQYFEEHLMEGPFTGRMDREICYMGTGEYVWFHAYLRRGEWKKAFLALRANMCYGMTQDTFQVQERFSRRSPAYTPWQPNGSGNGRMLDMMIDAIWFTHGDTATLLGAIPFDWLLENGTTSLHNLYSDRGRISIDIEKIDDSSCRVDIRADSSHALPAHIRVPGHLQATWDTTVPAENQPGMYTLPPNTTNIAVTIVHNEND